MRSKKMNIDIVYCSVSFEDEKSANIIQSKSMIRSFRNIGCFVHEVWKSSTASETASTKTLFIIGKSKAAHYLYLILMPLYVAMKFKNNKNMLFFTRSIIVAYIFRLTSSKMVILELHNSPRWWVERFICKRLLKQIKVVCISKAVQKYYDKLGCFKKSVVLHDAHNFKIFTKNPNIGKIGITGKKINVGYFGKYSMQKGSIVLEELIKNNPDLNFYVHTLNINPLRANNIIENSFIERKHVQEKMMSMDILLLFIVPTGEESDISKFTSPLKLFEYAACGKFIIASDVPVLKELEHYEAILFAKNNSKNFSAAINKITTSEDLQNKLLKGMKKLAEENTWDIRARKVMELAFN
jgi:glycosyltransferase involved in cell wall biosynthesis